VPQTTPETTPDDAPATVADLLSPTDPACWLRGGDGLIGQGAQATRQFDNPAQAAAWWFARHGDHGAPSIEPSERPIAFVSFPFDHDSAESCVVVAPERVVRTRGLPLHHDPLPAPLPVTSCPGTLDHAAWSDAVTAAVTRIDAGEVEKVVLARDEILAADQPIDSRHLIVRLSALYPTTWVFSVAGLIGATPELLVSLEDGRITSRVLAGTIARGPAASDSPHPNDPDLLADQLTASEKDLAEHRFAVDSVAEALRPYCSTLEVPTAPRILTLPNVLHLATDIVGTAKPGVDVITLAAAIHPSAAVCGHPRDRALALIRELESLDRRRYAGPVGWVDSAGDGAIGLALRCGHLEADRLHIYAGCGIVAGSDPDAEYAESEAKLRPMRDAL
jgi:menaquinone-specific isochorismate synthase